jgi:hypothetical protein
MVKNKKATYRYNRMQFNVIQSNFFVLPKIFNPVVHLNGDDHRRIIQWSEQILVHDGLNKTKFNGILSE